VTKGRSQRGALEQNAVSESLQSTLLEEVGTLKVSDKFLVGKTQ